MNLFVLRHGKAFDRSPKWRPDSKRPLTPEGETKMFDIARGIRALDLSFDLILASPYARTLRTAEILAEVFHSKKTFESKNLVPEANPEAVITEINENFSSLKEIVLVGHEPYLTRLISTVLSGGASLTIDLKKGGLARLSIDRLRFGQCASLNWLMTPRQLARLGRGKS